MPGYGESNGSMGVDYVGKTQPPDADRDDGTAKFGTAVILASEQPLAWTVLRCTAQSGRRDDRGAPIGALS